MSIFFCILALTYIPLALIQGNWQSAIWAFNSLLWCIMYFRSEMGD
jgi:hypothetical protein